MCHILGTVRPTNFKLRIRWSTTTRMNEMRGDLKGQRSSTSHRQFDACLPVTRQRRVAVAPKLAGRLSVLQVTLHTSSSRRLSRRKLAGYPNFLTLAEY